MTHPAESPAEVPADRRELMARLLARKAAAAAVPVLPRTGEPMECSHEQRRVWLAAQAAPETAPPNVTLGLAVTGELDLPRLAAALAALVARHEALRTWYVAADGLPRQAVRPAQPVPLELVDLTCLPEPEREPEALALALAAAGERFDLERGPLLRLTVYRVGPLDHRLLLVCHHIACDGSGVALVAADLAAAYAGEELPPPPALQYADYAAWSLRRAAERAPRRLPYWRERLAGLEPLFPRLPAVPAAQGRASATARVRVGRPVVERLRGGGGDGPAGGGPVTPFAALLAAYLVLLHEISGRRDLVTGAVTSGRGRRELEPVVGSFVNLVPLRVGLDGLTGFPALLARVRETVAGALANEIPFDALVSGLGGHRLPGVHPSFHAAFVHRGDPAPPAGWAGLDVRVWEHEVDDGGFDLGLTATPRGGTYELALTGRLARFTASDLAVLAKRLAAVVEGPYLPG
ncbi:Linear gramicidin synthase subunit B [Nonomuraea coxensis DSM 45129]|uniref:Linear gramicidin synthase subunit B n=1 Tax=Nonomuraea coxensis DSM 45129 TaxID=1122611 RepID=A0ABX8U7I6_9ACTN|nr:condensation domain-containing protein [Nonomuraea coxensis]QYC42886.1 Linear gramicidin synthase subunit B [Nonomuraea coxensis DSM 45129]